MGPTHFRVSRFTRSLFCEGTKTILSEGGGAARRSTTEMQGSLNWAIEGKTDRKSPRKFGLK